MREKMKRILVLVSMVILSGFVAYAQQVDKLVEKEQITMERKIEANSKDKIAADISDAKKEKIYLSLPEITITATRIIDDTFNVSKPVSVTGGDSSVIQKSIMMNEALDESPGVFMQKTTQGHGSPIIRGFIGRENLVLIDGIRLNNSTLRSGPVQYMNTVDNFMVDRIEIVRGPGSSLYGSDALGGVINIITENPVSTVPFTAKIISRGDSSVNGTATRLEANGKAGEFNYLFGGTYKNIGNLRAGGNFGVLTPTGFNEQDANGKISYNISKDADVTLNYQYTRQNEVPLYDSYKGARMFSGTGGYEKYIYNPQERHLGWIKYEQQNVSSWMDSFSVAASFQRQFEGRQLQKTGKTTVSEYEDNVDTLGFTPQFTSKIDNNKLVYGFEYYQDYVQSRYWDYNTNTQSRAEDSLKSTFPDGSKYNTAGVFLADEWQVSENFKFIPEARYSRFEYNSIIRGNPVVSNIGEVFQNITGNLGAMYKITKGVNLCGNISQGFRAPNLDDLVTLRVENLGIDVPNYDLRPEKNTNIEIGVKGEFERINWSAFYYFSDVTDKIDRKPGDYNGVTVIDGKPVYQKFNIGKGQLQGSELNGRLFIDDMFNWSIYGNLTWTEGKNLTDCEPLSRVPPLNGMLGVRYEISDWGLEAYTKFAGRQDALSTRDKTDSRMDPNGTPAWFTLNARGNLKINDSIKINSGVENILDRGYRLHSSGVDASGINFFLGIEAKY